jgi:phage shock protein C
MMEEEVGSNRRGKFRLNRSDKKVMGVCAGIADHFDIDVTLVRVGMALFILSTMPVGLFAYLVLAMVAERVPSRREREPARVVRESDTRDRVRELEARLQAMEARVSSPSSSALAREIDSLR